MTNGSGFLFAEYEALHSKGRDQTHHNDLALSMGEPSFSGLPLLFASSVDLRR